MKANAARVYPETRYEAPSIPDLSRPEERRRLSPAAARAFLRIVDHWQVRDEDARTLLGGMSNGSYYQLKQKPGKTFDQDRLLRISYLIGIFKALNILYSEKLADRWMQLPNRNPLFAGKTPLEFILTGGTPAMDVVRRLLDARRGGH
jgi:uncharacterized protein (DUF2384 family)